MKSDLYTAYRSVTKPKPLWPEVGLYGGYEYIEIGEGLWLPRTHEAYVQALLLDIPEQEKSFFKKAIDARDIVFKPSFSQLSDSFKLRILLNRISVFAIQGYSQAAEQFLSMINYTKIYTDKEYQLPNIEVVSTELLCALTANTFTLMHYSSTRFKSEIRNWGNVLVYDANTFDDNVYSNLIGG